jgi:hypothetical protein
MPRGKELRLYTLFSGGPLRRLDYERIYADRLSNNAHLPYHHGDDTEPDQSLVGE